MHLARIESNIARRVLVLGSRSLGAVALIGLSVGACSSDPDVATQSEPVSPALDVVFDAICDLSFRCCTRGEVDYFVGPYVDEGSCVERLRGLASLAPVNATDLSALAGLGDSTIVIPNLGALDEAATDYRLALRPGGVQACAEYIDALACNESATTDDETCTAPLPRAEQTPCDLDKLFAGLIPEGGTCTSAGFSLECRDGLVCGPGIGLGVQGRCVPAKQQDEPCFSNVECDTELYCSILDGTCQRPRDEGEVCVFADRDNPAPTPETLLLACRADLSCDPVTSICVAACQRGAKCDVDEQCDAEKELSCIAGRCGLPRGEGLPCFEADDCESPLTCVSDPLNPGQNLCSAGSPIGAVCSSHLDCDSQFCHPDTERCAAPLPPGNACLSGQSAECADGVCVVETPGSICVDATECPLSGVCDPSTSQCASYCIAAKQDGATCAADQECVSTACVASFCRSLPLDDGNSCEDSSQCDSGFCSYEISPTCQRLPLDIGANCFDHTECDSGVCFSAAPGAPPTCTTGLDEGQPCSDPQLPPCNPKKLFCDFENEDPPSCVLLKETGEICKGANECRGECTIMHGRQMCSPAAPDEGAICDGSAPAAATSLN